MLGMCCIAKSVRVTLTVGLVPHDGVTIIAVVIAVLATVIIGALTVIVDVGGA